MPRSASGLLLALILATASVTAPGAASAPAALASPAPAAAQSSSPVNYVALGDSYSAGVGTGETISSSGSCDRSPEAYSALWAAAENPASYVSVACGGATTSSVISDQLSALSSSTTLVSITIGGNDVGFEGVMQTCYFLFFSTSSCVNAIDGAEAEMTSDLPGQLDELLSNIAADAPNARVIVLGYPDFYDLAQSCTLLNSTDRTAINQAIDMLDSQLQAAASQHGDVFADVRSAFVGHQICDSDSWLHTIDWTSLGSSFHPTADGQSGAYYPVLSAAAAG